MASSTVHSLVFKMMADTRNFEKGVVASKSELRDAKKVIASTRTPLEKYQQEVDKLGNLLSKGAINQKTYNRAVASLRKPAGDASNITGAMVGKFGKFAAIAGPAGAALLAVDVIQAAFRKLAQTIGDVVRKTNEQFAILDKLAKTSDKLGIVPEQLQKLSLAARLSADITEEQFNTALQRMTRRVAEAAAGSKELEKAFNSLGTSGAELMALAPEEQFKRLADGMQGVNSQAERVRLTFKIFDTEGVNLVNTLAQGSAGIDALGSDIDRLNLGLSRTDLSKIEAANDAWTRVRSVVDAVFQKLAVEFAPIMEALANTFLDVAGNGDAIGNAIEAIGQIARAVIPPLLDMAAILVGYMERVAGAFQLITTGNVAIFQGPEAAISNFNSGLERMSSGFSKIDAGLSGELGDLFRANLSSADRVSTTGTSVVSRNLGQRQVKAQEDALSELRGLRRDQKSNQIAVRSIF